MNKIYSTNIIVSSDTDSQKNYVLSNSNKEIIFPFFEITSPRFLFNEIRSNVRSLFSLESIKFIEEIILSFTEVQNEYLIKYIESLKLELFDTDNDIQILSCIILAEKIDSSIYWHPFKYDSTLQQADLKMSLIDYCIQKSIL